MGYVISFVGGAVVATIASYYSHRAAFQKELDKAKAEAAFFRNKFFAGATNLHTYTRPKE